jgi:hypothetical protein
MNPGVMKTNIMGGILGEGSIVHKLQQTIIGWLFQTRP